MKLKEMNVKVQKDLGEIPYRRARCYVSLFHNNYRGRLEAITDISATYTDDGMVRITYIINGKENFFKIGNENLYSEENKKRKNKSNKK